MTYLLNTAPSSDIAASCTSASELHMKHAIDSVQHASTLGCTALPRVTPDSNSRDSCLLNKSNQKGLLLQRYDSVMAAVHTFEEALSTSHHACCTSAHRDSCITSSCLSTCVHCTACSSTCAGEVVPKCKCAYVRCSFRKQCCT